jgi:glycosyltransferase involved in cell wall biosynthesis
MPKPKLLIIINRLVIGGQVFDTFPLANILLDDFEILIAYGKKEEDEIEANFLLAKYPFINVKKINSLQRSINPIIDVIALWHLIAMMYTFKPNIVHTHGAKSGMLGRLAAFIMGVKVTVHTFHGHLFHSYFSSFSTRLMIKIEKWLAKKTSAIIALSETQKLELQHWLGNDKSHKIHVINLGIDSYVNESIATLRQSFRQQYNVANDTVAIGILGRLVGIKNLSFFCVLANKLLAKNKERNLVFFVVGDGEEKKSMQNYFTANGIAYFETGNSYMQEPIIFTSWVTNMQAVIEGLDIVLITSFNEGTPMSLLEAQFYGKPVVAVNVGGVKDTFVNNESGFLIEGHNIDAFVEKITTLATDKTLRENMGARGKAFVKQRFSKHKEVDAISSLYFSLL